jgi:prepilin signal peptidase PulO-like enzyme (type II secretory pathway)
LSEQSSEPGTEDAPTSGMKSSSIESLPARLFSDDDLNVYDDGDGSGRPRRRRRRCNLLLLCVVLFSLLVYGFYVFVLPEIQVIVFRWRFPKKLMPAELAMEWSSRNLLRTCEFLFLAWFFYFGASIASFLNVVAWRMPQGRTIVFGGSKCPYCDTRLSFLDNTPVLGWLLVQGKCRTCHLPIAPRYLIIEIVIGGIFVWLALWQLIRGGANLPHWDSLGKSGLTAMVFDPQWTLIVASLAHAGMFAVLVMLAVANGGKQPFPVTPLIVIAGIVSSHKFFSPALDLVAWYEPFFKSLHLELGPYANRIISILIGGAAGAFLGWLSSWIVASRYDWVVRRHWILQCFLIGSVLGWQGVSTIVVSSLVCVWLMRAFGGLTPDLQYNTKKIRALGLSACLIVIGLVHHSMWRQIAYLLGIAP